MKHSISYLIVACLFFCTFSTAVAEVPQLINYQGMLTDATGGPLTTADYDLTFGIYESETDGPAKWEETHLAVPVVKGYFNVILGGLTPNIAAAFDTEKAYLGVSVAGGEQIEPRQRILSTRYAIESEHSRTAEAATVRRNRTTSRPCAVRQQTAERHNEKSMGYAHV